METQILKEIKEVRSLLSQLIGTSELPAKQKFSVGAIDKASQEFKKLSIKRGEWIPDHDISKVIRSASWRSGKLIIEKFEFTNYFKHGRSIYYNKKDLIALNNELKERNINLKRYQELLEDQEKFDKKIESLKDQTGKKKKHFKIPEGLRDINTTPYTLPSDDIIKKHIASLKEEFKRDNLSEYIDVYHDTYAMMKFEYHFERYLNPELKKRCRKWCEDFDYANRALMEYHKLG